MNVSWYFIVVEGKSYVEIVLVEFTRAKVGIYYNYCSSVLAELLNCSADTELPCAQNVEHGHK